MLVIKPCKLKYDHYALKDVEADITVAVNGDDINQSTISLRLTAPLHCLAIYPEYNL